MTGGVDPPAESGALAALRARARTWIAGDPDPGTRRALSEAVEAGDAEELTHALAAPLRFGTAGLRGPVGPGPARMNRATVIRVSHGLAQHVRTTVGEDRPVVVGFDARPDSARFARDAVGVLCAAGLPVAAFDRPVPTPVVAHAARVAAAAAAVVVTASHNPPADNGYKVYGPDAIQIVPPDDRAIAQAAETAPAASEVPRADPGDARVRILGEPDLERYLADVLRVRPQMRGPAPRVVYTPLHGVAGELATRALAAAGYGDVHVVAAQQEPDGTFPTVASPNPEESGVLDRALTLAGDVDADLVLANDPDGDRLAVAVPDPRGGHRILTGNQIGVLLGDHLLRHTDAARPVVASSVVSSPMFAEVAAAHGARHEVTHTGFKWICRAAVTVARDESGEALFGYEEALGYAVGTAVLDKDGISAAVTMADLVCDLAGAGLGVLDRLDELYRHHGLWVSCQHGVALEAGDGPSRIAEALDAVSGVAGGRLGGRRVLRVEDHRRLEEGPAWRGPAELVEVALEGGGRALLRPSGTEAKVKVYVDLRTERSGSLAAQEARLLAQADRVAQDLVSLSSLG